MALKPILAVSLLGILIGGSCAPARRAGPSPDPPPPEAPPGPIASAPEAPPKSSNAFDAKIRPILEARCRPCHFEGGTMYGRLPFDRPQTIRDLGEKLFTRIKDEDERNLIRCFLSQPRAPGAGQ